MKTIFLYYLGVLLIGASFFLFCASAVELANSNKPQNIVFPENFIVELSEDDQSVIKRKNFAKKVLMLCGVTVALGLFMVILSNNINKTKAS